MALLGFVRNKIYEKEVVVFIFLRFGRKTLPLCKIRGLWL